MAAPMKEDDREELVAYLDGEVTDQQARDIENKLGLDPKVRAEAETLKRTWDLLDHLPKPEASANFTNRTLDRLSVQETRSALARTKRSRWLKVAGWAAAVLLIAFGSYFGTRAILGPSKNDSGASTRGPNGTETPRASETDLVRELRLIDNLRYYEPIGSIEFLRELDQRELFGEDLDS